MTNTAPSTQVELTDDVNTEKVQAEQIATVKVKADNIRLRKMDAFKSGGVSSFKSNSSFEDDSNSKQDSKESHDNGINDKTVILPNTNTNQQSTMKVNNKAHSDNNPSQSIVKPESSKSEDTPQQNIGVCKPIVDTLGSELSEKPKEIRDKELFIGGSVKQAIAMQEKQIQDITLKSGTIKKKKPARIDIPNMPDQTDDCSSRVANLNLPDKCLSPVELHNATQSPEVSVVVQSVQLEVTKSNSPEIKNKSKTDIIKPKAKFAVQKLPLSEETIRFPQKSLNRANSAVETGSAFSALPTFNKKAFSLGESGNSPDSLLVQSLSLKSRSPVPERCVSTSNAYKMCTMKRTEKRQSHFLTRGTEEIWMVKKKDIEELENRVLKSYAQGKGTSQLVLSAAEVRKPKLLAGSRSESLDQRPSKSHAQMERSQTLHRQSSMVCTCHHDKKTRSKSQGEPAVSAAIKSEAVHWDHKSRSKSHGHFEDIHGSATLLPAKPNTRSGKISPSMKSGNESPGHDDLFEKYETLV